MSTYKVIQDIEAEDHILGPLSLRQFIYGLITAFFLYICFIVVTKGIPFLLIVFLPPALFTGFFAFPFGKDQPTEVWALAKLRFLFKPRKRIWNQSGVKELVSITVPKKIIIQRTDGLSETEVRSRLQALANTIDSRGWAIKNVSSVGFSQPGVISPDYDSERLLNIGSMPRPVPEFDIPQSADILDEQASPLAQQFTSMINTSTQNHRKQLMDELADASAAAATAPQPQWFNQAAAPAAPIVAAAPVQTSDEALSDQLRTKLAAQAQANLHLHTLQVTGNTPAPQAQQPAPVTPPAPVTHEPDAAILNLAKRNDLNVSTLAREAGKAKELKGGDEVVISLH